LTIKKSYRQSSKKRNYKLLTPEYATFRSEILEYIEPKEFKKPTILLDPMAGTAPLIPLIEINGHKAYFNDILPLHGYINKAKTYDIYETYNKHGYDWFFQQLVKCMSQLKGKRLYISEKPIEEDILAGLIKAWHAVEEYDSKNATLLKAVILVCVRPLSSITKTENPTWFKAGGMSSGKDLQEIIKESLMKFHNYYSFSYNSKPVIKRGTCIITTQSVDKFRPQEKVNLIITSPPYCNRMDYKATYRPENYFLAAAGEPVHESNLIGTTMVKDYKTLEDDYTYLTRRSAYAKRLLDKVKNSKNRDDPVYYFKYYTRYFAMVTRGIIDSVQNLLPSGKMYIVTQDNVHRGQMIEIDTILRELLGASGWQSRIVKKWERSHLGLRNISREHALVKPKQFEKMLVIWQ